MYSFEKNKVTNTFESQHSDVKGGFLILLLVFKKWDQSK